MNIFFSTATGLFFGTIGTFLGGLIGVSIKKISNKFLSFVLALASGLMLAVICFELLPEARLKSSNFNILFGVFTGIVTMIICDILVDRKLEKYNHPLSTILKTGIIVSIGLAIHNIPEGLAIGTGLENSIKLGYSLALTIAFHDIPEGISMAAPMKKSGIRSSKILLYVFLSGIATGVGALFGSIFGSISSSTLAFNLAFAAGAMLYIVSGELTPEYSKLCSEKISAIANLLGFILGYAATHI